MNTINERTEGAAEECAGELIENDEQQPECNENRKMKRNSSAEGLRLTLISSN
jgi:hypothetical protein